MFGIESSFDGDVIGAAGADLSTEEEKEFQEWLPRLLKLAGVDTGVDADQLNELIVLSFVAGRAYQSQFNEFQVRMTPELAGQFMEFLAGS